MANNGISSSSQSIYDNIERSQKRAMDARQSAESWTVPLVGFHIGKGPFADKQKIAQMDNYLNNTLPELMKFIQNRYNDDEQG